MTTAGEVTIVTMPRLSDQMEEATIAQWLVADGDPVDRNTEIVEIETDKATVSYEAEVAGVLQILAPEGALVALDDPIAAIHPPGTDPSQFAKTIDPTELRASPEENASAEQAASAAPTGQAVGICPASASAVAPSGNPSRVAASPLVRKLARQASLDLHGVVGTGPNGRIRRIDIDVLLTNADQGATVETGPDAAQALAEPVAVEVPSPVRREPVGKPVAVPLTRRQKIVAERMALAKSTAPEFTASIDIDVTEIMDARRRLKEQGESAVPTINDFVVKAVALATRQLERFRSVFGGTEITVQPDVHVGVAVEDRGDLLVPVIRDADDLGLAGISARTRSLAAAVREQNIRVDDLTGAVITVSNLGMHGVRSFQAILNSPQSAILAVGAVEERPVIRDGAMVGRHLMNVTVTADHRVIYGSDAAQFLTVIRRLLEEPVRLAF